MKSSIKEALKSFFLPFRFQMYFSCINYIHVLSFSQLTLENVYKISENVSFCYSTEITIALKKMYPRQIVYEVNKEFGGGELSPACLRVGKIPPGKEKKCKFGAIPGGSMVTDQIEPCIILTGCGISRPSRLCSAGSRST